MKKCSFFPVSQLFTILFYFLFSVFSCEKKRFKKKIIAIVATANMKMAKYLQDRVNVCQRRQEALVRLRKSV
jgi:hypothetical protein